MILKTQFNCARRTLILLLGNMLAATTCGASSFVISPLDSFPVTWVCPARVATDAQSGIYITDPLAGKLVVADAQGQLTLTKTNLDQPLGVAVDGEGRIYVGDAKPGAVNVYDDSGNFTGQLGQGAGEFQLPGHIATSTHRGATTVYVSDGLAHCVKSYRDGAKVGEYGSYGIGPNQFNFPAGIWAGADGTLFVVDQENDRVQVLDADGNFLRRFYLNPPLSQAGASGRAQGITGDNEGHLYVADTFQGYVKVFDVSGTFLGFVGSFGKGPFQFRSPSGIAFDSLGRLWVANANNAHVDGFCFVYPTVTPVTQSVAEGGTVRFTADPGCDGLFAFQWMKDSAPLTDGSVISGASGSTLTLSAVTAEEGGTYSVQVGNASGTTASSPAMLTVLLRPFIVKPPADEIAPSGSDITLSVTAGGNEPLFYRWFQNGSELPGQTHSDLTLSNVTTTANGIYTVEVTNSVGSVSASAKFAVETAPVVVIGNTLSGDLTLTWNNPFCILQSAPTLNGPWQDLAETSPHSLSANTITQNGARFFRLKWP